ncbi:polyphosphate kinase 2 family protein [Martelella mediterranea]|uniref:PPK2 family polyphosphate:nucleotide phosphotransferase n=1 Tax=Martelella mediterranea TaxID=293089 RepID=A0A4R3P428_9HYPH|nr:polyphosphate kinase 2 family protein [Martelella mediterranea]TCT42885.1 PPK2 family polyphosphate:nucleotide phosphotransferase [Martelella mediterranea]
MDYRKKLMVKPGSDVSLRDIAPDFHGPIESKQAGKAELEDLLEKITPLQENLYAEKKHALLIVLQGIDAAGKDGVCWHVIRAMNPQGTYVASFKQPTEVEKQHDFLWRVHQRTPALGQVAVFNRSHYEDVLVARVHDLVPERVWSRRYRQINHFEEFLAENGVSIVKFFLYISKDEQLERFEKRLRDKDRQWKISASDYAEREHWDAYIEAYEAMLSQCSTEHAPWYVLPANHKWFRNLAAANIIFDTLKDMNITTPKPTVDIDEIYRRYHHAVHTSQDK